MRTPLYLDIQIAILRYLRAVVTFPDCFAASC